ncbi:MAG: alpha/beta hydrolase [Myxococcales bacterium]
MSGDLEAFLAAPVRRVEIGTTLAYRKFGQGPAVVLVHGWPLNGATYRGLVRVLSPHMTCYVPDLPGSGESPWDPRTREVFADWGALLVRFVDALRLDDVALIGHDSGGAIARVAAAALGERVRLLGLIATEVTNYVPPLVRFYQALTRLPGAVHLMNALMKQRWYRRSRLGFGDCFANVDHIDGEFHRACVEPNLREPKGAALTLAHVDLSLSMRLAQLHARIQAPVVTVWGDQDVFFPIARARAMQREFPRPLALHVLPGQKLLVHDERPDLVGQVLIPHLQRVNETAALISARGEA